MMDKYRENSVSFAKIETMKQYDLFPYFWGYDGPPLPPQYVNGPIIRDHFLLEYCTVGKGLFQINDARFPLEAGQCIICYPHQTIIETADSANPWSLTWIGFQGLNVPKMLQRSGVSRESPVLPWRDEDGQVLDIIQRLRATGLSRHIYHDDSISIPTADMSLDLQRVSLLYELFSVFVRRGISSGTEEDMQSYYVQKAIAFMNANFFEKITVTDIAKHVGLTRSYLFTLFKRYAGKSPQEYLTQIRIRKACDFFSNPLLTVNNVALSLGYEPRTLNRVFKQYTGLSPSEYRQQLLEKKSAELKIELPEGTPPPPGNKWQI